jgi:hypothetical protein
VNWYLITFFDVRAPHPEPQQTYRYVQAHSAEDALTCERITAKRTKFDTQCVWELHCVDAPPSQDKLTQYESIEHRPFAYRDAGTKT